MIVLLWFASFPSVSKDDHLSSLRRHASTHLHGGLFRCGDRRWDAATGHREVHGVVRVPVPPPSQSETLGLQSRKSTSQRRDLLVHQRALDSDRV